MSCRINTHRLCIGVYSCYGCIHVKEVAIFVFNDFLSLFLYRIPEIEIYCKTRFTDSIAGIAGDSNPCYRRERAMS